LRRKTRSVSGTLTLQDGTQTELDEPVLLRPLELALGAFSWGVVLLGLGLVAAKLFYTGKTPCLRSTRGARRVEYARKRAISWSRSSSGSTTSSTIRLAASL
jgi:hypothetical protein